ncbi:hypothetical protein [Flavobacterium sp.]|uniref:hypothetical protein n=1 Tax=Flavobacterium sp. TaxID=239 RepID=UPI0037528AE7
MKIIKQSGLMVDFDKDKLKQSLLRSGANKYVVDDVLQVIEREIYEGIPSKKIFKLAFSLLKKVSNANAARYNLKEGIRLLGPAGFFFEKYIARVFASENYKIKTNLILQGKCVSHEIDVLIKKNNLISMIECKLSMGKDANSDVKVPLYILSRFNDLKNKKLALFEKNEIISECWIATNNRFTTDAITFAKCSGLHLLSWNYPEGNNLKTKNDNNHLYPITCLTTLSISEKDRLLILDVILVKELINNAKSLEKIGLSSIRIKNVLKEVSELCKCL